MFQNVQNKLTALYVLTAGVILTAALGITAVFLCQAIAGQQETVLLSNVSHIISRLQSSNRISDSWLEELEMQNRLLIRIEENEVSLLNRGNYAAATDRDALFDRADAIIDGRFRRDALTSASYQSPVFSVTGDRRERYLGVYLALPVFGTYLEITVLNDMSPTDAQLRQRMVLLLILEIFCLLALFCLGKAFVRRALVPVRENEKRQQEFVSAASHELRTPITLIQGAADSILSFPEQTAYFQKLIQKECRRMTALITDLLALTTPDGAPGKPVSFDAATLVLELYEAYQPLCQEKDHPLVLEMPEEFPPPYRSNPSAVSQILRIFLDNAAAYSSPGEPITLKILPLKNRLRFQVIDHGEGIPDEQKEQIFQRFYRSDNSRNDRNHFGLGLSIARKYAAQIQGKILLEDTPGGGCTFSLELSDSHKGRRPPGNTPPENG